MGSSSVAVTLLAAGAILIGTPGCIPEDTESSATAQFTIWCKVTQTGVPVNNQYVDFRSEKYGYDGGLDEDSMITLGKTTASFDPAHPGSASFLVGYTLHQRGQDAETAYFTCSAVVPGAGSSVQSELEMGYAEMATSAGTIERELVLAVP